MGSCKWPALTRRLPCAVAQGSPVCDTARWPDLTAFLDGFAPPRRPARGCAEGRQPPEIASEAAVKVAPPDTCSKRAPPNGRYRVRRDGLGGPGRGGVASRLVHHAPPGVGKRKRCSRWRALRREEVIMRRHPCLGENSH